jgi:nucleotide-binding universal stress UspA family protein
MTYSPTPGQTIAKAVARVMVIAAIAAAGYVAFVKAPSDLVRNGASGASDAANKAWDFARRIAKDIDDTLHFRPRITSGGVTVVQASESISELSLKQSPFDHTYSWSSTWMGSTNQIKLTGKFIAKAGYDLTKPFSIDVSEDGQTIRATMPPAKINSVELISITHVVDEHGLWNRINEKQRQDARDAWVAAARKQAESSTLLSEADAALMAELEKIVRKSAPPSVTIVRSPSPLP